MSVLSAAESLDRIRGVYPGGQDLFLRIEVGLPDACFLFGGRSI
jgi:hypothetical protein